MAVKKSARAALRQREKTQKGAAALTAAGVRDQDRCQLFFPLARNEPPHVGHAEAEHGEDAQAAQKAQDAARPGARAAAGAPALAAEVTAHLLVPVARLRVRQVHAHDFLGSCVGVSAGSPHLPLAQLGDGRLHLPLGPVRAVSRARGVYRTPLVDPVARAKVLGVPDAVVAQPVERLGVGLVAARAEEDHHHEQPHEDAGEHPATVED